MTCDFKISDVWIEFFGLQGQLNHYDELVKQKKELWKERKLKTISIYPKDLFPKNKLESIFSQFVS